MQNPPGREEHDKQTARERIRQEVWAKKEQTLLRENEEQKKQARKTSLLSASYQRKRWKLG